MDFAKIFAQNLKNKRKSLSLTQKQLADKIGYSEKSVCKWESGEAITPSYVLPLLSSVLGTTIDCLFENTSEPLYFLGIDGGGTKTEFLLTDSDGNTVKQIFLGACNPVDIGMSKTLSVLESGIAECCVGVSLKKVAVFAGIAGGITGDNKKVISEFLSGFGFSSYGNGSDAESAVASCLDTSDGISVILGTGDIAFTQKDGVLYRTGGFGYLFDEGGSGYSIGRDGILYALKDEEGSAKHSLITQLLKEKCGTDSLLSKLGTFYSGGKREIASYAPIVFRAYEKGDAAAYEILKKNFKSVAVLISDASRHLDTAEIDAVLTGSITKDKYITDMIKDELSMLGTNKKFNLSICSLSPVMGAIRLARRYFENGTNT